MTSSLRAWCLRFTGLFDKERKELELAEELESHLQMHVEDNLRSGMPPWEARRDALLKLGGVEQTKEDYRERRGLPRLESLVQDLRYGLRILAKNPGFAAVAALTFALGIGANSAIFSVVNAVLLRPLPFHEPGQLMIVWHTPPQKSFPGTPTFPVSPANFIDWRSQNHGFEDLAAIGFLNSNLTGTEQPESVAGAAVSADFFSLLRIQPAFGRAFLDEEDQPGRGHVVVIADSFCQSHFGAARNALGKTIQFDDQTYVVVGVMPPQFDFPFKAQFWRPLAWSDKERAVRGVHDYMVIARLKPKVEMRQAQAEMDAISNSLAQQYPIDDTGWGAAVLPLREQLLGSLQPALLILLGAVGFVLLIACANVANLTLAKAFTRRKEIAIRMALGAGRMRVAQQVLSETLLLSITGGALALLLAHFLARAIAAYVGQQLPLSVQIGLDGTVLAFTMTISVLTGIFAGLIPCWHLTRTDLNASLKEGLGKTDADSGGGRLKSAFVVSEVALSLVLLAGAGLMIRTLFLLRSVDAGIDPHNVLTVPLAISNSKYPGPASQINFFNSVLERVRVLPGVESAGAVDSLPLHGGSTQPVAVEDQPVLPMADQPEVEVRQITPHYLAAMRIPLRQGRDFTAADKADSQPVILVSESFARRFWPHENPVGKHVTLTFSVLPGGSRQVVGVVGDVKLRGLAFSPPVEAVYSVMAQNQPRNQQGSMVLTVRTASNPASLTSAVAGAVHAVDPDEPVVGILSMEDVVDQSLAQQRLSMTLLAAFAGLALLLAVVGIYGVQSYSAKQQAREIGIRIALGAQRSDVFLLFIEQGMKLALLGVGIGLAGSLLLTRLIESQLYGLRSTDPLTFAGVSLLLAIVVIAACYFPARRAMRVDPMVALRNE